MFGTDPRADLGFLGVGPDNNQNKSLLARVSVYPLPDLQFGGSIVWGKYPRLLDFDERLAGKTTIDVPQAPSWRAGAHLGFDLDRMLQSPYPLPSAASSCSGSTPRPRLARASSSRSLIAG